MKQTKMHSLLEQFVQAGLKYGTALIVSPLALMLVGIEINLTQNMVVTFIMMLNSIFFGYWIRRGFDWYHHKEEALGDAGAYWR